ALGNWWRGSSHRGPQNIVVDVMVGVDQPISHSHDGVPRHSGQLPSTRWAYLVSCFPNNFECSHQGEEQHLVGIEIGALPTLDKAECGIECVDDVTHSNQVIRTHIALRLRERPDRESSG